MPQVLLIFICYLLVLFSYFKIFYEDVLNDEKKKTVASAGCVLEEPKEDRNSS